MWLGRNVCIRHAYFQTFVVGARPGSLVLMSIALAPALYQGELGVGRHYCRRNVQIRWQLEEKQDDVANKGQKATTARGPSITSLAEEPERKSFALAISHGSGCFAANI